MSKVILFGGADLDLGSGDARGKYLFQRSKDGMKYQFHVEIDLHERIDDDAWIVEQMSKLAAKAIKRLAKG